MCFRTAVTNLAVTVLLGCPYVCLAEASATRDGAELARRSCCNCCEPKEPAQAPSSENDSDGGPGSCLCGGALIQAPGRTEAPDPDVRAPLAQGQAFAQSAPPAATCGSTALSPPHFPPTLAGRLLRTLIGSLLL